MCRRDDTEGQATLGDERGHVVELLVLLAAAERHRGGAFAC